MELGIEEVHDCRQSPLSQFHDLLHLLLPSSFFFLRCHYSSVFICLLTLLFPLACVLPLNFLHASSLFFIFHSSHLHISSIFLFFPFSFEFSCPFPLYFSSLLKYHFPTLYLFDLFFTFTLPHLLCLGGLVWAWSSWWWPVLPLLWRPYHRTSLRV